MSLSVTAASFFKTTAAATSSPSVGCGTAKATAWEISRVLREDFVSLPLARFFAAAIEDLLAAAGQGEGSRRRPSGPDRRYKTSRAGTTRGLAAEIAGRNAVAANDNFHRFTRGRRYALLIPPCDIRTGRRPH